MATGDSRLRDVNYKLKVQRYKLSELKFRNKSQLFFCQRQHYNKVKSVSFSLLFTRFKMTSFKILQLFSPTEKSVTCLRVIVDVFFFCDLEVFNIAPCRSEPGSGPGCLI